MSAFVLAYITCITIVSVVSYVHIPRLDAGILPEGEARKRWPRGEREALGYLEGWFLQGSGALDAVVNEIQSLTSAVKPIREKLFLYEQIH